MSAKDPKKEAKNFSEAARKLANEAEHFAKQAADNAAKKPTKETTRQAKIARDAAAVAWKAGDEAKTYAEAAFQDIDPNELTKLVGKCRDAQNRAQKEHDKAQSAADAAKNAAKNAAPKKKKNMEDVQAIVETVLDILRGRRPRIVTRPPLRRNSEDLMEKTVRDKVIKLKEGPQGNFRPHWMP